MRPLQVTFLDLDHLSAPTDPHKTSIRVQDPHTGLWHKLLEFGSVGIRTENSPSVYSYLANDITDPEHDSVQLFSIPLVSPTLKHMTHGSIWIQATVGPVLEDFRVPTPDWNPLAGLQVCPHCKDTHSMVEHWIPPINEPLYHHLRGLLLDIRQYSRVQG